MNTHVTKEEMKRCGVYKITNVASGKIYVGSASTSFLVRWKEHVYHLNRGTHRNKHLQASWVKRGESAFVFSIMEVTLPEHAIACEQCFLDWLKPWSSGVGYNIGKAATAAMKGRRHSETSISLMKTRQNDPKLKAAKSARAKAMHASNEFKAERSAIMKRINADPVFKTALSVRSREMAKTRNADPEFKKASSERRKVMNADPEFKEWLKARNADPVFKAALSARTKAMHDDPVFRASHSSRMKARHADPVFKENLIAAIKAMHADPTRSAARVEKMKSTKLRNKLAKEASKTAIAIDDKPQT